jgi:uncharacterized protein
MVFNWGRKMVARQEDDEDMTMEEILASIRRYVSDEKPSAQAQAKVSEFKPSEEQQDGSNNAIVIEPNLERQVNPRRDVSSATADVFELTEEVKEESTAQVAPIPTAPETKTTITETVKQQTLPEEREMSKDQLPSEDPMTSSQTRQASLSALSKLTEVKKTTSGQDMPGLTLDKLVTDLARPMVKEWLDKNLSTIVERMVAREIDRITRELHR